MELTDDQERMVRTELKEHLVFEEPQEQLERSVHLALQVSKDHLADVGLLAQKEPLVQMVQMELLDQQGQQDHQELKELLAPMVLMGFLDVTELQESQELQDL